MSDESEYEVGYGRPPKSGRFKKGQSGNPKGRPKGRKALNTIIDDVFRKKMTIRVDGKTKKVSQFEALCRRIFKDGLKGDGKATDQAIKLIGLIASLNDGAALVDDGSIPNEADDLEALKKYLGLFDISPDVLNEGGQGDE